MKSQEQTYRQTTKLELKKWIHKRIKNANTNITETVQIPFVIRSTLTNRNCANYYIGTNPEKPTSLWIAPIAPRHFPHSPKHGSTMLVIGNFTG